MSAPKTNNKLTSPPRAKTLSPEKKFIGESDKVVSKKIFHPPLTRYTDYSIKIEMLKEEKEEEKEIMEECIVCTENIVAKNKKLNCGHYLCTMCTCELIKLECPFCRAPITKFPFIRGTDDLIIYHAAKEERDRAEKASQQFIQAEQAAQGQNIQYDI